MTSVFSRDTGEKRATGRTSQRQSQQSFVIERGVPLARQVRAKSQLPLLAAMEKCEVGDSFLIPVSDAAQKAAAQVSIMRYKKRLGVNFATRTVEGGLRVWRVT